MGGGSKESSALLCFVLFFKDDRNLKYVNVDGKSKIEMSEGTGGKGMIQKPPV